MTQIDIGQKIYQKEPYHLPDLFSIYFLNHIFQKAAMLERHRAGPQSRASSGAGGGGELKCDTFTQNRLGLKCVILIFRTVHLRDFGS